jgi:hypothetical protein
VFVLTAFAAMAGSEEVRAAFVFTDYQVTSHFTDGTVDFEITFNQVPDFTSRGPVGNPLNSLVIYTLVNPYRVTIANNIDTMSGVSMFKDSRGDVVSLVDADDRGTTITTAPYVLTGTTITYTLPLDLVSTTQDGGRFSYLIETMVDGKTTKSEFSQTPKPVPEPAAATLCGLGLIGLALSRARSRRARTSSRQMSLSPRTRPCG